MDVVKQICPKIVSIPDRNYIDHKLERREEMEATLLEEKSTLKIQHSELGLLYQLYGKVDSEELIRAERKKVAEA